MRYTIDFTPAAERQFRKLPRNVQATLRPAIDALAAEPRPPGVKKLTGTEQGTYRIREDDYRIVYDIDDDMLLVLVVRVGNRRDVYR